VIEVKEVMRNGILYGITIKSEILGVENEILIDVKDIPQLVKEISAIANEWYP